ncbi:hypothetical protein BDR05DRAFT_955151 [Suillus weaverae]|nr:hypothetical protein BDR05DRAFT_955151 [Suillus weaverae]
MCVVDSCALLKSTMVGGCFWLHGRLNNRRSKIYAKYSGRYKPSQSKYQDLMQNRTCTSRITF